MFRLAFSSVVTIIFSRVPCIGRAGGGADCILSAASPPTHPPPRYAARPSALYGVLKTEKVSPYQLRRRLYSTRRFGGFPTASRPPAFPLVPPIRSAADACTARRAGPRAATGIRGIAGMRKIPGPRATFALAREDDFSRSRARKPARTNRAPRTSRPHGRAGGAQYAGAKRLGQQNSGAPRRLFSGRVGELVFLLECEAETRRGATNMRFLTRWLRLPGPPPPNIRAMIHASHDAC